MALFKYRDRISRASLTAEELGSSSKGDEMGGSAGGDEGIRGSSLPEPEAALNVRYAMILAKIIAHYLVVVMLPAL